MIKIANLKIIVVTLFFHLTGFYLHAQDGTVDNSFVSGTARPDNAVDGAREINNLKTIVYGWFDNWGTVSNVGGLVKINSNGSVDNSFNPPTTLNPSNALLLRSGKILIYCGGVYRLNIDGSIDSSFGTHGLKADWVTRIIEQQDGKCYLIGACKNYDNKTVNNVFRILENGNIDTTFRICINSIGLGINDLIVTSDNKLVLCLGFYENYQGTVLPCGIVKVNQDGSIAQVFSINNDYNGFSISVVQQADGSLIVGGQFSSNNNVSHYYLLKLNSVGQIDLNYKGLQDVTNLEIQQIYLLSNNYIIVHGKMMYKNENPQIIRVTNNGVVDSTFSPVTADDRIHTIGLQKNGKILVGGEFMNINYGYRPYLARINNSISRSTVGIDVQQINKMSNKNFIQLIQNPTNNNTLKLNINSPCKFKVYDQFSRLIYNGFLQNGEQDLYLENLIQQSIYYISVEDEYGNMESHKFFNE